MIDSTTVVERVDSTVGPLSKEILARIDALGVKLGVAGGHIWAVLVRQGYAEAARSGVWALFMVALSIVAFRYARRFWNEQLETHGDGAQALCCFLTIAGVGALLIGAHNFSDAVGYAINPEYYAFEKVAELFK
jgi:hypothetical protein